MQGVVWGGGGCSFVPRAWKNVLGGYEFSFGVIQWGPTGHREGDNAPFGRSVLGLASLDLPAKGQQSLRSL